MICSNTSSLPEVVGDAGEGVAELGAGRVAAGEGEGGPAVGGGETAEQSFRMLGRGGTANIIGMIPVGVNIELHGADFLGEKKIQGSLMGSNRFPVDMPRLVDFYMAGKLKLDQMISRRIKLEDVNEGLEELKRGELARSVIMFN